MEKEIILHAFSIELQSHLTLVLAFDVIPITETWKWRSVLLYTQKLLNFGAGFHDFRVMCRKCLIMEL